jgi:hypothetical protein
VVKRGIGIRADEVKGALTVNCGEVEKRPRGCRFIDPTNEDGPGAIIPTAICALVLVDDCGTSIADDEISFLIPVLLFSRAFDSTSDTTSGI